MRPGWELGFHNYLKESYYSDELFRLPVPTTLKRLLLKELSNQGTFSASQDSEHSDYVLDLKLQHFFVRTERGIVGLIPFLPLAKVEAVIDFEVKLKDQDGRVFLDKRYASTDPERSEEIEAIPGSGTDQLLGILTAFMSELVSDLNESIPKFWAELGLEVPQ
jgi:hypothetical protein